MGSDLGICYTKGIQGIKIMWARSIFLVSPGGIHPLLSTILTVAHIICSPTTMELKVEFLFKDQIRRTKNFKFSVGSDRERSIPRNPVVWDHKLHQKPGHSGRGRIHPESVDEQHVDALSVKGPTLSSEGAGRDSVRGQGSY